ncbi:MAG: hypothetical protein BA861_03340 [Desulfobacterales bacterium S3730MH5]|nr:MAG: hypothetical protein BA861_03340 [Desulfobacterales bacterium S3730MH5]OEU81559.1 MAG: hypothetical protein BA865_07160 [Desulfobacterales bacterium S5133MH4]
MSAERGYKRKRFFNYSVKTRLQLRMLVKIWSIVLVSLLLTGIIFYFYSDINVGKSYRLFHVKAKSFLDFLLPVLLTGFFVSLILGVVAAIFFPHAIAGPLYRIENELIDIGKGNLRKEIKLRKGSEMHDLADAINVMVASLRHQIKIISGSADEIGKLVQETSAEDTREIIDKIRIANTGLQEAIRKFEL